MSDIVIKKKKKMNTTTLVVIIVCAFIVLACVAFVGWKLGWFHVPAVAKFTVDAHDELEIEISDVEVSDDDIQDVLDEMQSHFTTEEQVTDGKVADGDEVHITYVGKIDGEEFDGGSSGDEGYDLTIGSGSFIDGFEDGLIGKKIGDTVTLELTFPEDYSSEDVAGKDVTFEVEIQYVTVENVPEITNSFIKENSAEFILEHYEEEKQIDTVDDMKDYIEEKIYNDNMETAVHYAIVDLIHVETYDEVNYNNAYNSQLSTLEYYASMYTAYGYGSYTADSLAQMYGYDDAAAYADDMAKQNLDVCMIYAYLADELGIDRTNVDERIQKYIDENDLSDSYESVDAFKEAYGDDGMYQFESYIMVSDEVIEKMTERVVLVDTVEEETDAEDADVEDGAEVEEDADVEDDAEVEEDADVEDDAEDTTTEATSAEETTTAE